MNEQISRKASLFTSAGCLSLLLVLWGTAAYINGLGGKFIFDDWEAIVENPYVRSLWPPNEAMSAPLQTTVSGRPVVSLSLALNHAVSGYNVWSYHSFNLAIHILAALTLFGVVRQSLLSERLKSRFGSHATILAWIIAAIWMVHPIQTESVTYIVQRTESLMGLFYLLTLYAAILAMRSKQPLIWSVVSVLCCGLGMAAKEVMVTAPVIVLLYDKTFEAGSFKSALKRRWGLYAGLAATWAVLGALMWTGPRSRSVGFSIGTGAFDYAVNQCVMVVHYIRLVFWPHPLVFDYGYVQPLPLDKVVLCAVFLLILLGATITVFLYRPAAGFLGGWFFIILGPTSSFIPIATAVGAEHRMYLPLAAPIVLLVTAGYVLLQRIVKRFRPVGIILVIVILTALTWVTVLRNRDYANPVLIWQKALKAVPNHHRGHYNLGNALKSQSRLDEAIGHYRQALRFRPNYAEAHYDWGIALQLQDKINEAISHYRQALQINPDYSEVHNNLALALKSQGKVDEAVDHYRWALQITPDDAEVHNNLGNALKLQGKFDEAVSHYIEALRLDPQFASAHNNLGVALVGRGRFDEAAEHFSKALRIKPDFAEARRNLERLTASRSEVKEKEN